MGLRSTGSRLAVLAAMASLASCRSPTQISVVVTTTGLTCDDFAGGGAALAVAKIDALDDTPPSTTSQDCKDLRFGEVVIIPSGDDGERVAFKVVGALRGASIDDCSKQPYGQSCIVARRSLNFLPHTPIEVPVVLAGACIGVPCTEHQTCVEGACVSAEIDPAQCEAAGGCPEGVLFPGVHGGDAGVDATVGDGAADGPNDATIQDAPPEADTGTDGNVPLLDGAVLGCDLRGTMPGAAWPMEGYCPSLRYRSPLVGPVNQPGHKWTFVPRVGAIEASPSVGPDGTVYVGSRGSLIDALGPDGGIQWEFQHDAGAPEFWMMPVLAADGTVRSLSVGDVYASLDARDGGARLTADVTGARGGITIAGDGTMYAANNTGDLVAFLANGSIAWLVHGVTAGDGTLVVVAADGTVLTPGGGGGLYGLRPEDGGVAWHAPLAVDAGANIGAVAEAPDGTLRAVDLGGRVYELAPDGGVQWARQPMSNASFVGMAIADDGTTYLGSGNEGVIALTASGGDGGTFQGQCGVPVIDATGVIFAHCASEIYAFNPNLTERWHVHVTTSGAFIGPVVLGPGGMIYASFYVFDEDAGTDLTGEIQAFGP